MIIIRIIEFALYCTPPDRNLNPIQLVFDDYERIEKKYCEQEWMKNDSYRCVMRLEQHELIFYLDVN